MAFIIKSPPEFTLDVEQWDRGTKADGAEMAHVIEKLLNNDVYIRAKAEQLHGTLVDRITISLSKWEGLTYTIANANITASSEVYVFYDFDSIPVAQKANIRGRAEDGKLVLTARKLPVSDLIIERMRIINLDREV